MAWQCQSGSVFSRMWLVGSRFPIVAQWMIVTVAVRLPLQLDITLPSGVAAFSHQNKGSHGGCSNNSCPCPRPLCLPWWKVHCCLQQISHPRFHRLLWRPSPWTQCAPGNEKWAVQCCWVCYSVSRCRERRIATHGNDWPLAIKCLKKKPYSDLEVSIHPELECALSLTKIS